MVVKDKKDKEIIKIKAIPIYRNKTMKECNDNSKTFEYIINLENIPIDMYNHTRKQAINSIYYKIRNEFSNSSFVIILSNDKVIDMLVM